MTRTGSCGDDRELHSKVTKSVDGHVVECRSHTPALVIGIDREEFDLAQGGVGVRYKDDEADRYSIDQRHPRFLVFIRACFFDVSGVRLLPVRSESIEEVYATLFPEAHESGTERLQPETDALGHIIGLDQANLGGHLGHSSLTGDRPWMLQRRDRWVPLASDEACSQDPETGESVEASALIRPLAST